MKNITSSQFRELARQSNFWDRVYNDQRYIEKIKLASNNQGYGASLVGISDTAGYFTAKNVEDALAEIYVIIGTTPFPHAPVTVVDSATVDLTLVGQQITADVIPGGISHTDIADIGTNTHAQIDDHIADASIHFSDLSGFDTDDLSEGAVNKYFPGFTDLATDYGFTDNSANWDTAYSWGNHADAGYLTTISGLNISLLNNDAGFITDLSGFDTDDLAEGSNLYFTNARAITALTGQNISIFTNDAGFITAGDIDWATNVPLNETDPVFSAWLATPPNISTFTNDSGYITGVDWDEIGGNQSDINISGFTNDSGFISDLSAFTTTDLVEGTNLYYTEARVSANADVAANTAARHSAVTVTDSTEINFTLTGQDITASIIAGSIDETKLDVSINASLDLADSSIQPLDNISELTNDTGFITDLSGFTTTDLTEGTNLYFTDERAQDAIGGILSNEFTYDDGTPSISLNYTNISHTSLQDIGTNTHAQIDTFIGTTVPNTYVPYTGATDDVDLGSNNLTVNQATIDVSAAIGCAIDSDYRFKTCWIDDLGQGNYGQYIEVSNTNSLAAVLFGGLEYKVETSGAGRGTARAIFGSCDHNSTGLGVNLEGSFFESRVLSDTSGSAGNVYAFRGEIDLRGASGSKNITGDAIVGQILWNDASYTGTIGGDVIGLRFEEIPSWTVTGDKYFIKQEGSNGVSYFEAPIQLNNSSLLATPQAGTFEFTNDRMYLTNVGTQRAIDRTSDVITSTTTVANTTTETTLFTGTVPANSLKVGNVLKIIGNGLFSTANASDTLTIRIKIGSTTVGTLSITPKNYTNEHWDGKCLLTVRSIGVTGTISVHCDMEAGDDVDSSVIEAQVVDTTTAENITITAQWDNALAGNTISIYQGFIEYKN